MKKALALLVFLSSLFLIIHYAGAAEKYALADLSPQQIDYVNMALQRTAGIKVLQTATIKSHNHPKAYYVGVSFTAPGVNHPMVAVWLMSGAKVKPGKMFSVNAIAYEFSRLGLGSKKTAATSLSDREYKILQKHLPVKNKKSL